jgi:hypothetical protein
MRIATVLVLLMLIAGGSGYGQTAPPVGKTHWKPVEFGETAASESAGKLIKDVIYNELHDWKDNTYWEYRSHVVKDGKDILREQIETPKGPVYEILARDGKPLQGSEATQEKERLASLVRDPAKLEKVEQEHESDEARLGKIMALIPNAYVFHYVGRRIGDRVVLEFAPNPKFSPSGYVARVMCGLTGKIVVNQRLKRMVSMDGALAHKVNFGFGILGYVDQGGMFRIHRTQVSATHWKTDLVDVNVHGRILLFSNVSKQEKETRWGFTPVAHDITLAEADSELKHAASAYRASQQAVTDVAESGETPADGGQQR